MSAVISAIRRFRSRKTVHSGTESGRFRHIYTPDGGKDWPPNREKRSKVRDGFGFRCGFGVRVRVKCWVPP